MRKSFLATLCVVAVAACADSPATPRTQPELSVAGALPDLIVDARATQNNWVVRVEDLPANFCSVQEGNVTPGVRTLLRFSVTTPNVGEADVHIGNPLAHVDPNGDGNFSDSDGLYEFASCHNHFHFQHYATYRLLDEAGNEWKSAKRGFCMLDTDPYNTKSGDGSWQYRSCGTLTRAGNQGISKGWADTYTFKLAGQYFVLDGGDHQPVVPPGKYIIEVVVNPPFAPGPNGCLRAQDPATGMCHQFAESNYANNTGRAYITIPDHPGRSGYGPLKNNTDAITAESETQKGNDH